MTAVGVPPYTLSSARAKTSHATLDEAHAMAVRLLAQGVESVITDATGADFGFALEFGADGAA